MGLRGSLGAGELESHAYAASQNFGTSNQRGMFLVFCNTGSITIAAGGGDGTIDLIAGSYWEAPRAFSTGTFEIVTSGGTYSVFTDSLVEV